MSVPALADIPSHEEAIRRREQGMAQVRMLRLQRARDEMGVLMSGKGQPQPISEAHAAAVMAYLSQCLELGYAAVIGRAMERIEELLQGDGFTQVEADTDAYCPMCGRSRTDGHKESCARYVLAEVMEILRGPEIPQRIG